MIRSVLVAFMASIHPMPPDVKSKTEYLCSAENNRTTPANPTKDGKMVLTFDPVTDEGHHNWRQQSRLSEVWLFRNQDSLFEVERRKNLLATAEERLKPNSPSASLRRRLPRFRLTHHAGFL